MSGLHIQHKRNYHAIRWTVVMVVLIVVIAYIYFGIRWYNTGIMSPLPLPVAAVGATADESAVTDKQLAAYTVKAIEPRFIEIPKLGISSARVSKVGVTQANMLDMPKNTNDAAWYVKSAAPGSGTGAVLLDGYSETQNGKGLFAGLSTLKQSDQISIERGDGKRFTYEVHDVRTMPIEWVIKAGMKEMMYSVKPEKEGLSIITDGGKWIPKNKTFDSRVLVRATIVE